MALFDLPLDQLRHYAPEIPEPSDFDGFWRESLATAGAGPVILALSPAEPTGLTQFETWDVTFSGFNGDPVRAWYTRPVGIDGPLPGVVEYLGYGRGRGLPHERLVWPAAGFAHLLMDSRGQGDQYGTGGDTPDPEFGGGTLGGPGPVTRGIRDPYQYYYRRLITDAVRAVAALRALPGVDAARVSAVGNSQGGGLALAVAGLVPDLFAVLASAPFLCHMQRAIDITDAAPYGEIVTYLSVHRDAEDDVRRTLSYVDAANLVRRAKAPAHFGTGLRDTVCPPSTVFAAYNHYGAGNREPGRPERDIHVYPFNHHEGGDAVHSRRQLLWLRDLLAGSGASRHAPAEASGETVLAY